MELERRWHRRRYTIGAMFASTLLVMVVAAGTGPVNVPPGQVAAIVASRLLPTFIPAGAWPATHETIVWVIRLPRVVMAALAGAGLALAGATYQGIFRNPMADPYVIGVSSGGALGAVLAMVAGVGRGLGAYAVPACAFAGALLTLAVVYYLARVEGRLPVIALLLAGVAVSTTLSAVISLLIVLSRQRLEQVIFWLMGGFTYARWPTIGLALPYLVIGALTLFWRRRELNALLLGDEAAAHLGVEVEVVKRQLLAAAALITAAVVSVSGLIGFVGLVIPHTARLLLGADHRWLLPGAALAGATGLVLADALARTVLSPAELPVGVVTALVGGPFFLVLLARRKRAG
jgi:iron complex transport system permease protein